MSIRIGVVLTLVGFSSSAIAEISPYVKIYPQWQWERYSDPSRAGDVVGNMGTLRSDTVVLSRDARPKAKDNSANWLNSYVGLKGDWDLPSAAVGFDVQYRLDLEGDESAYRNLRDNLRTRNVFVFVDGSYGRVQLGKMESIYRNWAGRYPMLGVSSGNFVATSRILSRAGWRGAGSTSFHNRRSQSVRYESPVVNGFQWGLFHSWDESDSGPGGPGTKLNAIGVRWQDPQWYVALVAEEHVDWLPMSRGALPELGSIQNNGQTASSRDHGVRLAFGWRGGQWRLAGDIAQLRYRENDMIDEPGKFRSYQNRTWQISADYQVTPRLSLAVNRVQAGAGSCELSGSMPCSTENLGGSQSSVGALYAFNPHVSVFALAADIRNNPAASYQSVPQGARGQLFATGIKVEFR